MTGLIPPKVSIGLPVYNGEATIGAAIESIVAQTFTDFELIISDNASTDRTPEICQAFASADSRISIIRQPKTIESDENFEAVYGQAVGEYFMWAPAHYSRSVNFIEANIRILEERPDCVFASSPNVIAGRPDKLVSFALEGPLFDRVSAFLDHCWASHACFYSLFRRSALDDFSHITDVYLANDWTLVLHLLEKGTFCRSADSLVTVGVGKSRGHTFLATSRTSPIHSIFPLFEFSRRFYRKFGPTHKLTAIEKTRLALKLAGLNFHVAWQLWRGTISASSLFRARSGSA